MFTLQWEMRTLDWSSMRNEDHQKWFRGESRAGLRQSSSKLTIPPVVAMIYFNNLYQKENSGKVSAPFWRSGCKWHPPPLCLTHTQAHLSLSFQGLTWWTDNHDLNWSHIQMTTITFVSYQLFCTLQQKPHVYRQRVFPHQNTYLVLFSPAFTAVCRVTSLPSSKVTRVFT